MIGHAYAARDRSRQIRGNAGEIARYFSVPPGRLEQALEAIESGDNAAILLLQSPPSKGTVDAVTFFSSVWSRAYEKVGTPYGKVHRDFHYQILFSAIAPLVEVGCDRIRVENPMSGYTWKKDAYVCLLEAFENVRAHMNPAVCVYLEVGSYNERMVTEVDRNRTEYRMQAHRPIGTHMHVSDGINMRTVFVERATSNGS